MEKIYKIGGMSCEGCRKKVEEKLSELPVISVEVNLNEETAIINSIAEIPLQELQNKLSEAGNYQIYNEKDLVQPAKTKSKISESGQYQCPMFCEGKDKIYHNPGNCPVCGMFLVPLEEIKEKKSPEKSSMPKPGSLKEQMAAYQNKKPHQHSVHISEKNSAIKSTPSSAGKYYCPMHCEGDKLYDHAGNCPVCGMNLEKIPDYSKKTQYTCPMHPEIVEDQPGSCPKCGMDLVPIIPEDEENSTYQILLKKFWIAVGFTLPIFILSMGDMLPGQPISKAISPILNNWLQFILSLPVVFYATWMFFERAWNSFKTWNLNMFSLIGLGAGAAFLYSVIGLVFPHIFPKEFIGHSGQIHLYFESATVILTLVLLGQLMEAKAHSKTNKAIKGLINLAPSEATLVENGKDKRISVHQIQVGNILKVKAGEKIPVDGKIVEGNSSIDESMITGESIPVEKQVGENVTSGTLNGNRTFLMKAERVGDETLLSQIIRMVNDASRSKAPIQKMTDKVSKIFVPAVIIIAIITFFVWYFTGPEPKYAYAFGNLLAVLIVACPCALGLATPMSVMVGVGKGARNGILIKNAEALETLNKVNILVTDKTGTLTEGKPSVNTVVPNHNFSELEILKWAASLNQDSTHPLAEAILNAAKSKNIDLAKVQHSENISGKGIIGTSENQELVLGNLNLLKDKNIAAPEEFLSKAKSEQSQGKTLSYLSINGEVAGFISISDKIKNTSKEAVKQLQNEGVQIIMITGDNEETAKAVAKELGIENYIAEALPEDKLNEIKKLQQQGKVVAMAGDGINDAPALAQANVGIAMDSGTDVAIESAEITLLKGDLNGIKKAINLSHKMVKNIKENLVFAFLYNSLGIPIAAGVFYVAFGWLLSPMLAAAAMSFSSVSVIANSLRLNRVKI